MNEREILLQYMKGLGTTKVRRPLFLIVHENVQVADELAYRLSEVMEKEYVRKKTTNAGDGHGYYDWVDPDDVFSADDVSRHVVGTEYVD